MGGWGRPCWMRDNSNRFLHGICLQSLQCQELLYQATGADCQCLHGECQHQEVTGIMLQEFPDIDSLYKSRTLARLVAREQFDIAATFVGQDRSLQVGVGRSSRLVGSQLQLCMLTREAVAQACSVCRPALSLSKPQRLWPATQCLHLPGHSSFSLLHTSPAGMSAVAD